MEEDAPAQVTAPSILNYLKFKLLSLQKCSRVDFSKKPPKTSYATLVRKRRENKDTWKIITIVLWGFRLWCINDI